MSATDISSAASPARDGGALVSPDWLQQSLGAPGLCIVDATYYLPGVARDARAEYLQAHVPGAVFLDYQALSLPDSRFPNTMPTAGQFARAISECGIGNDDMVVVYDQHGIMSAPRIWWMFRAFGHHKVAVLDGGLPRWLREGRPVQQGEVPARPASFAAHGPDATVCGMDQVCAACEGGHLVVDARAASRFSGEAKEPRPGLRSGHIPGSRNLPYERLLDADTGSMLPPQQLAEQFAVAGIDLDGRLICSCGSGVSACVLALALHTLGKPDVSVYDGSWTEWGSMLHLPLATGAA